jgi:hypothetical protein
MVELLSGESMAYRYGNREQCNMLPPCIDDYVGPDDPVVPMMHLSILWIWQHWGYMKMRSR